MTKEELKKETIKKLEEIKNNLSYDNEQNYVDMINTMIDYDNEAQDNLYLYDTTLELVEFVNDDVLDYLIKENSGSLERLRYFINDTEKDNIYKLNGYGNLENVDKSDFEYCIDEAIEKLKESLED